MENDDTSREIDKCQEKKNEETNSITYHTYASITIDSFDALKRRIKKFHKNLIS